MNNTHQKISASVVLYNTSEVMLARLLTCIMNANMVQDVYIVDNSPIALSSVFFDKPWVTYIRSEVNVGYGAGHNIALRRAISSSTFHFVLNPDIYFESEDLMKMIDRMIQDDSIGQLMPKVTYPDGSLQYLCKLIPSPADLFYRRFLLGPLKVFAKKKDEIFELRFSGYNREMNVPYLSGCFMLFRISSLREIGLFDERYFMYPEDIDITRRMHAKYRTIFFPEAVIVHDHAKESYKNKRMLWIHVTNLIKYFNKWGWFFDSERKKVNAHTLESLRRNHNAD